MKAQTVKVTLKFHPNKAIGEKYEVVKIVNAITVEHVNPVNIRENKLVRVSDHINEADATALADKAEVTVIPE